VGYGTIHSLLRGEILGAAVVGLLIGKSLVWSIALGSGTSGGVLAPLLMMGGALGALASGFLPVGDAGLWATVGMAAMMGGTMRSPLTAMVFTLELTSDFNLFPALLVGCVASYAVTVLLLRRSILTEKVARRGFHVTREYSVDPLAVLRVGEVMDGNPPSVPASMKVTELSDLIAHRDPKLTRRQGIPVVDEEGRLAGIITRGDVLRAIELGADGDTTVLDAGSRRLVVAYADELLHEAVNKTLRNDIGRLPVALREDPHKLVGYLGRASVMAARLRRHEEEHVREQGLSLNAT
jgi:CIC family chloride channel protein